MGNNNNEKTDWDKILMIAVVIAIISGISKTCQSNMVDKVMDDSEFREKMNIDNREEAEQFVDDYNE
ncbi:MAG TPA: hypothetical protein DCW95_04645 [Chryseobacterium sp.]|nr:hypothetical protein [Chryseobacterium sp.]